jgi:hypothetical protein
MENGAFYFFTREAFESTGSRLSGKVVAHEMDPDAFCEVDEINDLLFIQSLLEKKYGKAGSGAAQTRGAVIKAPVRVYPQQRSWVPQAPSYVPPPRVMPLGNSFPAMPFAVPYPGMFPPLGRPGSMGLAGTLRAF